jgi:hypothetical protein
LVKEISFGCGAVTLLNQSDYFRVEGVLWSRNDTMPFAVILLSPLFISLLCLSFCHVPLLTRMDFKHRNLPIEISNPNIKYENVVSIPNHFCTYALTKCALSFLYLQQVLGAFCYICYVYELFYFSHPLRSLFYVSYLRSNFFVLTHVHA